MVGSFQDKFLCYEHGSGLKLKQTSIESKQDIENQNPFAFDSVVEDRSPGVLILVNCLIAHEHEDRSAQAWGLVNVLFRAFEHHIERTKQGPVNGATRQRVKVGEEGNMECSKTTNTLGCTRGGSNEADGQVGSKTEVCGHRYRV